MNYKEKLGIMREICTVTLEENEDGSWSCNPRAEIKDNAILAGLFARKPTAAKAVGAVWDRMTNVSEGQYIVVNAYRPNRAAYQWSGKHWRIVHEDGN